MRLEEFKKIYGKRLRDLRDACPGKYVGDLIRVESGDCPAGNQSILAIINTLRALAKRLQSDADSLTP